MSEQIQPESAGNRKFFTTQVAVEEYSFYRLFPEEKVLFDRYYKPGDRILDLACGLGRTTLLLHEMGLSVTGSDTSEVFIRIARKRFAQLDLRLGSYDHIEEADASCVHVLISAQGLDLAFPESQRVTALRECARVLKPGGTLIYSSHNLKALHLFSPCYRRRPLWKLRNSPKAFRQQAYLWEDGIYLFAASPEYVIDQTESVGLKFLEMIGSRLSTNRLVNKYFSPSIHYAFRKPPDGSGPDRTPAKS